MENANILSLQLDEKMKFTSVQKRFYLNVLEHCERGGSIRDRATFERFLKSNCFKYVHSIYGQRAFNCKEIEVSIHLMRLWDSGKSLKVDRDQIPDKAAAEKTDIDARSIKRLKRVNSYNF